jgi:hypothetical protein
MSQMCLSTPEMFTALEVFAASTSHVLGTLSEAEHANVVKWLTQEIYPLVPCFAVRPDSFVTLTDSMFKDAGIRDFCLNLSLRFFTLCSEGDNFIARLAGSLANGLSVDGPEAKLSLIPVVIKDSLPNSIFSTHFKNTTLVKFLESNKPFMVVLMLHLTNPVSLPASNAI